MVNFAFTASLSRQQLNRPAADDDNIYYSRDIAADSGRLYHFFVSAGEKVESASFIQPAAEPFDSAVLLDNANISAYYRRR